MDDKYIRMLAELREAGFTVKLCKEPTVAITVLLPKTVAQRLSDLAHTARVKRSRLMANVLTSFTETV